MTNPILCAELLIKADIFFSFFVASAQCNQTAFLQEKLIQSFDDERNVFKVVVGGIFRSYSER